jgi:hypothetical protein
LASVRAAAEATEHIVVAVEDEDDEEAVRDVDDGESESAGALFFAPLPVRNGKQSAAPDGFLGFLRPGEVELAGGAGLGGQTAASSGSCGCAGSRVERSKSTSMMCPLS